MDTIGPHASRLAHGSTHPSTELDQRETRVVFFSTPLEGRGILEPEVSECV
jgi:hypothetical protein